MNYPLKSIFFFLFLKCFVIWGFAQDLSTFSLQLGRPSNPFSTAFLTPSPSVFSPPKANLFPYEEKAMESTSLQPAWINPDPGYLSFLCRKELEIEQKSPIAFWFQIGENDPALVRHQRGGAVSSFKLKFRLR